MLGKTGAAFQVEDGERAHPGAWGLLPHHQSRFWHILQVCDLEGRSGPQSLEGTALCIPGTLQYFWGRNLALPGGVAVCFHRMGCCGAIAKLCF